MQYSGIASAARHTQYAGLLLFDLDGTILPTGGRVSEATLRSLQDARDSGYVLAVCSGRCWGLMPHELVRSGAMDYYVCSNGSTVLDRRGRPLLRNAMRTELCQQAIDAIEDLRPGWNCFTGPGAFAEPRAASYMMGSHSGGDDSGLFARLHDIGARLAFALGGVGFRPVPSMGSVLALWHHGLEKMGASFSSAERRGEAVRRLRELGAYEVVEMGYGEIEVTAAGATKGTGTDWLLNHLALTAQGATAFGDSENDLPLLGHVGRFVAMGNATPAVKERADDVCGSLAEEGVAAWLEWHLRSNQQPKTPS